MFYRRFFFLFFSFCSVLLSWEHNWSMVFSSFVLGFRRNMGSVPHGCNSRCYCARGFLWKCCPKIPKTKAADMEGKTETLERIKSSGNSHSATLMKGGWGG